MKNKNYKEEYLVKVHLADLDLLRYYLKQIRFKTEPLIEKVNVGLYNCVLTTHNPLEQWAAIGIHGAFERRQSQRLHDAQIRHQADCQDHRRKYGAAVCHCDEVAR